MRTIEIEDGYQTDIDNEDLDLCEWKIGIKGKKQGEEYATINLGQMDGSVRYTSLHAIILERILGRSLEKGEMCDHKDGNKLNNTRSNLRIASNMQNAWNSGISKNNTSGYKGVHKRKNGCWTSTIFCNGVAHYLGIFTTAEDAHQAYIEAAKELFGEFAPSTERTVVKRI